MTTDEFRALMSAEEDRALEDIDLQELCRANGWNLPVTAQADEDVVYLFEEEDPSEDFLAALELLARFVRLTHRIGHEGVDQIDSGIAVWADGLGTETELFLAGFDMDGKRIVVKDPA